MKDKEMPQEIKVLIEEKTEITPDQKPEEIETP